MYADATKQEIEAVMANAWEGFLSYSKETLEKRAGCMYSIAQELEQAAAALTGAAAEETHLPEGRLKNELARTQFQLRSYADACRQGLWMDLRIDTALPERNPPRVDLRKSLVPLGPVLVFGASNFPFAYSTAGGDTACALAAGCPVVVKAHPAHANTSTLVASAVTRAIRSSAVHGGTFSHVYGASFETGKLLVTHPKIKAVGFTGSFGGGKSLYDLAVQRKEPIPVFAEMSSINPVLLLPGKLRESAAEIAAQYASSITLGVGQFCTNPGLLIGIEGEELDSFMALLGEEIKKSAPGKMLNPGIAANYRDKKRSALSQQEVQTIAEPPVLSEQEEGVPTLATTTAKAFRNNPVLHQEVFGPYSLVVRCRDIQEMTETIAEMEGQLTATLMATEGEILNHPDLVASVQGICGRFILNGVPTGVEVCLSMQHGGPFPSTTDSRFSSVGADGIKRFARPVCYQNWPDSLLPDELKNQNPLGLWRTVNNTLTREPVR